MGVVERKEREKQLRREQILAAGEKLILSKGLQYTTMDEIAKESELSKGTLYLYFESKDDIFLTLVNRSLRALVDILKKNLENTGKPEEKTKTLCMSYFEFYQTNRNHFKLMNFFEKHEGFEASNEDKLKELLALEADVWNVVIAVIDEGKEKGIFTASIDSFEAALVLWSVSNGIIQMIEHVRSHFTADDKLTLPEATQDNAPFFCRFEKINYEALLFKAWDMILKAMAVEPEKGRNMFIHNVK